MLRNSQKYLFCKSSYRDEILNPYGHIIISTFQPSYRSITITKCRCKTPNLNSPNFYDILGVERAATQKEIRKAFLKLSKEYHPDSNSSDKSLHDKFVKINQAFTILNKQSTRTTYDQSLNSSYRPYSSYSYPSRQQPFDWTQTPYSQRGAYQRRTTANESDWGTPHFDRKFYEMFRQRMEYDRKYSNYYNPSSGLGMMNTYFAPFTIITILIAFGIFIHALQWRIAKFTDPSFSVDPRSRSYHAYREWQRLSALKGSDSLPLRDREAKRNEKES